MLVNEIFVWMMAQLETNDLLKLANPAHCKDYVFLTKEALDRFMRQIQLEPKMGSRNILYFESVKQLTFADEKTAKDRPREKGYRDILCRQLAFFYVRIFQVFGALALTVIDSLPDVEPRVADVRAALFAGPKQLAPGPPLFPGARGGAKITATNASNLDLFYEYARDYFVKLDRPENTYAITDRTTRTIRPSDLNVIFFYPNQRYNIMFRPTQDKTVEANISIRNEAPGVSYTLSIEDIHLDDRDLGLDYNIPLTYRYNDYTYERKSFFSVLKLILESVTKDSTRGKSLEQILGEKKEAEKRREVSYDDKEIPESLSYAKIRDYLKQKPKAYCVARAIQLLSPTLMDGARKDLPHESDVCFFENPPEYMKDSVALYNRAITENTPGIRALNQLFYDVLDGAIPKMAVETKPKYEEFVRLMRSIFSPAVPTEPVSELKDVKSLPIPQCSDPKYKNKRILTTNRNAIREVQKSVAELLNRQIRHTAQVAKFFQKMFVMEKSGRILGIHPSILKGGIPAVNRLAEEARIMLTEYYKFCEGTFRLGALKVLETQGVTLVDRK